MTDFSDYTKPRTKLENLLPETFKSDIAVSVYNNLFNRFLTKNETIKVAGYIGEGNPNAIVKRQLVEPTIDRQANQLQPILNVKIGSQEYHSSWKDLQNEATRLGIDLTQLPTWGAVQEFNWVPPIDIDKLINYQNYYWYDSVTPNSQPDYIVIHNDCTQLTSLANFWQNLITVYGSTFPIVDFTASQFPRTLFTIKSITSNTVTITGNIIGKLFANQTFDISGLSSNKGTYTVASLPVYVQSTDSSIITVVETLIPELNPISTVLILRKFDTLVISGNFIQLFVQNLTFNIDQSTNTQINNSTLTVKSSSYDSVANQTSIFLTNQFTDSAANGNISLAEQLTAALTARDCACQGSLGWDQTQWDDNPNSPLWGSGINSQTALIAAISNTVAPTASPVSNALYDILWYDTTSDQLYQWSGSAWGIVSNSFSSIITETTGNNPWDLSIACGTSKIIVPAAQQWIDANKWLHKTDVPNFTTAKRAQYPIIEYNNTLELNEWFYITYNWSYRNVATAGWNFVITPPTLIELISLPLYVGTTSSIFYLDESCGNLTNYFIPNKVFAASNDPSVTNFDSGSPTTNYLVRPITVIKSYFIQLAGDQAFRTVIEVSSTDANISFVDSTFRLVPIKTTIGDQWRGYNIHWLFMGINDGVPINHQPLNPLLDVFGSTYIDVGDYQYVSGPYAQNNTLTTNNLTSTFTLSSASIPGSFRPLNQRALLNSNDIRVYINGIQQYGTYDELSSDSIHVTGIQFLTGFIPSAIGTIVTIAVGEASIIDFGLSSVPVLTNTGIQTISLIAYRIAEQIKTTTNQYPLFDLYNPDGTSAFKANQIFGFETDASEPIATGLNLRIIQNITPLDFKFEQFLVDYNNGNLYAYRDYAYLTNNYWVLNNNIPYTWNQFSWDVNYYLTDTSNNTYYIPVVVQNPQPQSLDFINGNINALWFNTIQNSLNIRVSSVNLVTDYNQLSFTTFDKTLQTIWKAGLNNELSIPVQVDWEGRSLIEYNLQEQNFVNSQILTLGITESQAQQNWLTSQINQFSANGNWVGDWNIPDPLYYNNLHENYKLITYRDLLTHFNSIINNQPIIPGFTGPATNMFHLLSPESVNFGLGGKIKEFNDGFDTFLSSEFSNIVTPIQLIGFAQEQYESLLNTISITYNQNLLNYLTTISSESLSDLSTFITNQIINTFQTNENLSLLYGDSSTYNQTTGSGIQNWIDTLVYLKLIKKVLPVQIIDTIRNINLIVHHDGHTNNYTLPSNVIESVSRLITMQPDNRGTISDTFGRMSTLLPPATISDFNSMFATSIINRSGVFWFYIPDIQNHTLYRLNVISSGPTQPVSTVADGLLWIDTSTNTLRMKVGLVWPSVTSVGDGIITSAWQPIDFNQYLNNAVLSIETALYNNAPNITTPPYNLTNLPILNNIDYFQNLQNQFLNYVSVEQISQPFANIDYVATDAFTWNYTYSTVGTGHSIIGTNISTQAFIISDLTGSFAATFAPNETFYVKNSQSSNDGTWVISSSGAVWNSSTLQTSIYVIFSPTQSIIADFFGILYRGDSFPSNINTGSESAGDWRGLYQAFYNTSYPHLEPWKLQGYISMPLWWNTQYMDPSKNRRWLPIMWTNIQNGVIPAGQTYPNNVVSVTGNPATDVATPILLSVPKLPSYNYFSVNIGVNSITGLDGNTYNPDELFPPYWAGPFTPTIRSLFTDINSVLSPGADYIFGQPGPVEWNWRASSQFLYDQLIIGFELDPVRFMCHTFGKTFLNIGNLQIDSDTNNTFSHTRTNFHGDVINNELYIINGLNQWYVNYNRYLDIDSSYSNFRSLWTGWDAPLTYQLSSFVDTQSFILGHRTVPISSFDWTITAKQSPGVEDYWLDAFDINVTNIPPAINRYNNEKQWGFEINTNLPASRTINYYDIQNYQFCNLYSINNGLKVPSNTFSIYTYPVIQIDITNNIIIIEGDQTDIALQNRTFSIFGSTTLDGTYTIVSAAYDQSTDTTVISTTIIGIQPGPFDLLGCVKINYRNIPWNTGELIYITTDETSPAPLLSDDQYFIIAINDTQFQLAYTQQDAILNIPIFITTIGRRNQYIGMLQGTFAVANTSDIWKHFVVDTTSTLSFTTPYNLSGIQNWINIIDGYNSYINSLGWQINASNELKDPVNTSTMVSWQSEIERFINYIFASRATKNAPAPDSFPVTVNTSTSEFTYVTYAPQFVTGDLVMVVSSQFLFPSPLLPNIPYYIIVDSPTTFRLAGTSYNASSGVSIQLENVTFNGSLSLIAAITFTSSISFELNPFRNGIWFNPTIGIVSDIFTGPNEEAQTSPLTFDQYGRALTPQVAQIMRLDKQTEILISDNIPNDVELSVIFNDPYNFIHLGGMHIFVDTFENIVVFNNYTTENQLIYDPFLGINVTKFELQFYRQPQFTERPNVGGFYLQTFYNQTPSLSRNIEAQVEDLRYLYDTYTSIETDPLVAYSRKTLGYQGLTSYLNSMNLDPKAQFIFWRGLIREKGSVNAVNAFINSRRFEDAVVDEFWAVKLANFGSSAEKIYPAVYLTVDDAKANQVLLEFVTNDDLCYPGYAENVYDQSPCGYAFPDSGPPILVGEDGFTPILLSDQTRWYNQPDVQAELDPDGGAMYFTLKVNGKLPIEFYSDSASVSTDNYVANAQNHINNVKPAPNKEDQGLVYFDSVNILHTFWVWDSVQHWIFNGYWNSTVHGNQSTPIIRHGFKADALNITLNWYNEGTIAIVTGVNGNIISTSNGLLPYLPFTSSVELFKESGGITIPLVSGIDYAETLNNNDLLLSTEIYFPVSLQSSDKITVIYHQSTLVEDLHYNVVNSDVISILYAELVNGTISGNHYPMNLTIWGMIENEHPQNPAKLIDVISETVISAIQLWDPARGINYAQSVQNIDLFDAGDPARYTNTPVTTITPSTTEDQYWAKNNIGTTWLDTTSTKYYTYYDSNAIPNLQTRFAKWGSLADWASAPVYEWVESTVLPAQWNAIAAIQENDITIPESQRFSGRIYQTLFKKVNNVWDVYYPIVQNLEVAVEGVPNVQLGIVTMYAFLVQLPLVTHTITSINISSKQFIVPGDATSYFLPNFIFGFSDISNPIATVSYTVASCALVSGNTNITVIENIVGNPNSSSGKLVDVFNTYLNGQLLVENEVPIVVDSDFAVTYPVSQITFNQHLTFVMLPPTDPTLIAAGVAAGTLLQDYQYTQVPYYDNLGNLQYTYYFWVINKITTTNSNRTLSPEDSQIDFSTNPAPYMFFQNVKDPATVIVNGFPAELPIRYVQCIIRGLRGLIDDNFRYVVRFTRDYTLRDSLDYGSSPLQLKNQHQEWELIRPNQLSPIRRALWDEITESIVGFNLLNPTIIVPSLTRQLYDVAYNATTSYGFDIDQAFANGPLARAAILSYLEDSSNDFTPIDISLFFEQNSFDTPANIISSMNVIYTTFPAITINQMFFLVLQNSALTEQYQYAGVLKTSMLSVTGVTSLVANTLYDD